MRNLEFIEASNSYENSLDKNFKKEHGVYYTDIELAKNILEHIPFELKSNTSIIDPACGMGSFLHAAKELGFNRIFGSDIDGNSIKNIRKVIKGVKVVEFDSIGNSNSKVLEAFGLKRKFDIIAGNPPYAPITQKNFKPSSKSLIARSLKDYGENLFIAGLLSARELVKDDGIISYIIPKNFLHINRYSLLRRELLRDFSFLSIIDLGIYFKKVRGEQVVLTIQKTKSIDNKVKFYNYQSSKLIYKTEVKQSFYKDKIIIFDNDFDFNIYNKFQDSYVTLNDFVKGYVGRGKMKGESVVTGKEIRKFGLKSNEQLIHGNQIFIQNIYSKESGIIACFAGRLEASETVTIFTDGDIKVCKYMLAILHSRLINFYLHRYLFNMSNLTMHVDAKYLRKIPFILSDKHFEEVVTMVESIEQVEYMSNEWFDKYERMNDMIYEIYGMNSKEKKYIELKVKSVQSRKWVRGNG